MYCGGGCETDNLEIGIAARKGGGGNYFAIIRIDNIFVAYKNEQ
jgi:hypothetical protein